MTPEERSLLERTYKLSEENNEILRSIRRSNRLSIAMRIAYWVVILVASFGAYYFIQPYVNAVVSTYSSVFGDGTAQAPAPNGMNSIMDMLK